MAYQYIAAAQFGSKVAGGLSAKRSSKALAKQAMLDAKAEEVERTRELNDAMAMQALMFGASGTAAGVGSSATAVEESLKEHGRDVKMIRAGGRAKAAGLRAKGEKSLMSSFSGGALQAGETAYSYSKVK